MTPAGETMVLGIETSCDETAAAVVTGGKAVLAESVLSQIDQHRPYGGVVPEIAARAHIEHLDRLVGDVMAAAGITYKDLSAVAATAGPGLIGGVLVGLVTAKAIAATWALPLIAVNHLEGHALSVRLGADLDFPYLLLLVSGGHCQLLEVAGVGRYRRLGTTVDDALGEAFDKTAKLLGLEYPGGPAIEEAALAGDPTRFALPRPMIGRRGCDFSFSGLKTAVHRTIERLGRAPLTRERADIAAAFQTAAGDVLCDRTAHAMAMTGWDDATARRLVVAGGVAANNYLRGRLEQLCEERGFTFTAPPGRYCTDNAAMIAWAGVERLGLGLIDDFDAPARARWPLDALAPALRRRSS